MKDNFSIHSWKLKQAINELEEKQCPDCGCKMEGTMCNECGYMEEAATFTDKHDDNPKLKGGQKDLPDEVQAKIVAKEAVTNPKVQEAFDKITDALSKIARKMSDDEAYELHEKLKAWFNKLLESKVSEEASQNNLTPLQQYLYDYEVEISGEDFANKELENIKKLNNIDDVKKYYGGYRGWAVDKDLKYDFYNLIKALKAKNLKEGEDHEVAMAQASLQAIISSAGQLMSKLGDEERNIPGWIQDHIVNAENYIEQANQGFHELDNEYEED